ncbi:hypothetical protein H9P43_008797 [Blastocladiella emersonii ATCC 22665]|nr:hypothetical protein H9P43_008797 [Blastocladiella emersonii ATCC 22665]
MNAPPMISRLAPPAGGGPPGTPPASASPALPPLVPLLYDDLTASPPRTASPAPLPRRATLSPAASRPRASSVSTADSCPDSPVANFLQGCAAATDDDTSMDDLSLDGDDDRLSDLSSPFRRPDSPTALAAEADGDRSFGGGGSAPPATFAFPPGTFPGRRGFDPAFPSAASPEEESAPAAAAAAGVAGAAGVGSTCLSMYESSGGGGLRNGFAAALPDGEDADLDTSYGTDDKREEDDDDATHAEPEPELALEDDDVSADDLRSGESDDDEDVSGSSMRTTVNAPDSPPLAAAALQLPASPPLANGSGTHLAPPLPATTASSPRPNTLSPMPPLPPPAAAAGSGDHPPFPARASASVRRRLLDPRSASPRYATGASSRGSAGSASDSPADWWFPPPSEDDTQQQRRCGGLGDLTPPPFNISPMVVPAPSPTRANGWSSASSSSPEPVPVVRKAGGAGGVPHRPSGLRHAESAPAIVAMNGNGNGNGYHNHAPPPPTGVSRRGSLDAVPEATVESSTDDESAAARSWTSSSASASASKSVRRRPRATPSRPAPRHPLALYLAHALDLPTRFPSSPTNQPVVVPLVALVESLASTRVSPLWTLAAAVTVYMVLTVAALDSEAGGGTGWLPGTALATAVRRVPAPARELVFGLARAAAWPALWVFEVHAVVVCWCCTMAVAAKVVGRWPSQRGGETKRDGAERGELTAVQALAAVYNAHQGKQIEAAGGSEVQQRREEWFVQSAARLVVAYLVSRGREGARGGVSPSVLAVAGVVVGDE